MGEEGSFESSSTCFGVTYNNLNCPSKLWPVLGSSQSFFSWNSVNLCFGILLTRCLQMMIHPENLQCKCNILGRVYQRALWTWHELLRGKKGENNSCTCILVLRSLRQFWIQDYPFRCNNRRQQFNLKFQVQFLQVMTDYIIMRLEIQCCWDILAKCTITIMICN